MAWDNTQPDASLPLNETVVPMRDNFVAIEDAFNINHGSLTDIQGNIGKHSKVSLTNRAVYVLPPEGATTIYAARSGLSAFNTYDVTVVKKLISNVSQYPISEFSQAAGNIGWTFLENPGLVLLWLGFDITTTERSIFVEIPAQLDVDCPKFQTSFYAHAEINAQTTITDPVDAVIYPVGISLNANNRIQVDLALLRRSSFEAKVQESQLPMTASLFIIYFSPGI